MMLRVTTCERATSQYGSTALVRAAAGGHKDMVELLADRGADLEARSLVGVATVCALRHGTAAGVAGGPGGAMAMRRWGVEHTLCAGAGGSAGVWMSGGD